MDRMQIKLAPLPTQWTHDDLMENQKVYWSAHLQYGRPGTNGVDYFSETIVIDYHSAQEFIKSYVTTTASYRDKSFEGYLVFEDESKTRKLFEDLLKINYDGLIESMRDTSSDGLELTGLLKIWFEQAKANFEQILNKKMGKELMDLALANTTDTTSH